MAAGNADDASRPRPRPGQVAEPPTATAPARAEHARIDPARIDPAQIDPAQIDPAQTDPAQIESAGTAGRRRGRKPTGRQPTGRQPAGRQPAGRQLARTEAPQSAQMMAAAGNAVVTAARMGRLLGRSYLRMAKQLPGVSALEAQAQRVRQAAAGEFARLLEVPQHLTGGGSNPEEQRVLALIHNASSDPEPLRSAMSELLERSSAADSDQSREYLFGSIVSQLVPDEARVLAALAGGHTYAAVDVVNKPNARSGRNRVVLANVSTIGASAGITVPTDTGTYLGRLQGFGLIDFTYSPTHLDSQFESLLRDPAVAAARASIEAGRQGSAKIVRKAVTLSPLGREFWAACAPSKTRLSRRGT